MGQVIAAIVVRSVLTAAALAQQPHSPPFEVVSIKPNSALDRSGMISSPAGSQLRVVVDSVERPTPD